MIKIFITFVIFSLANAQTCDEVYMDNVGFIKLGSFRGTTGCGQAYEKSYFLPKNFKTQWLHTRRLCQSYGMESLSLETKTESEFFLGMCEKNHGLFEEYTHVGAMTMVGKTEWHWVNSGKKINYLLKWLPGQPDFYASNEFCMGLVKRGTEFSFCDVNCYGAFDVKFICQRNEF